MKIIRVLFYFMCILQTYSLGSKIPVIIDTDVGTDIDDTWAVSYLLQQSQVEINLILTATHNTLARTKYLAKFLTLAGRSDIPIGIGVQTDNSTGPISGALYPWAQDFDLNSYSGPLYKNGVNQMIKIIENAVQKVVIVAIAPYTNLQTALQRRPSIVNNVLIVAMGGSFFVGYNGRPPPVPEYNIRDNISASQLVYNTSCTIYNAPLDVTVYAQLSGDLYQELRAATNNITKVLLDNYRYWYDHCSWSHYSGLIPPDPAKTSSTLHDLVTASMVLKENMPLFKNNLLNVAVNVSGYTNIAPSGKPTIQALYWKDSQSLKQWQKRIVDVLTGSSKRET